MNQGELQKEVFRLQKFSPHVILLTFFVHASRLPLYYYISDVVCRDALCVLMCVCGVCERDTLNILLLFLLCSPWKCLWMMRPS